MTIYTLTAEIGGFGWYHSWLLKDGTWDDSKWWADVAAWQANEGINFGFTQLAETGVFALTSTAINEDIVEIADTGVFSLSGQAAFKSLTTPANVGLFSVTTVLINEGIVERADVGVFSVVYVDALLYKPRYEFAGNLTSAELSQVSPNSVILAQAKNEVV